MDKKNTFYDKGPFERGFVILVIMLLLLAIAIILATLFPKYGLQIGFVCCMLSIMSQTLYDRPDK